MQPLETLCRLYGFARGVMNASGDQQQVVSVLVQVLVRLHVERERCRVPDDLIDANGTQLRIIGVENVTNPDQENRVAVDRAHINRAVKGDGNSGLRIEAVKLVQQPGINAVGGIGRAVGQWQIDPQQSILRNVKDSEAIAG